MHAGLGQGYRPLLGPHRAGEQATCERQTEAAQRMAMNEWGPEGVDVAIGQCTREGHGRRCVTAAGRTSSDFPRATPSRRAAKPNSDFS